MTQRRLVLSAAALLAGGLASTLPHAEPRPPAGPGGVLRAAREFLAAVDRGDRAYLERAVVAERGPVVFRIAGDGSFETAPAEDGPAPFVDVGPRGGRVEAADRAAFVEGLVARMAGSRTRVRTVRADCASERCSLAVVEFERRWQEAGREIVRPMYATALFRYVADEPRFRLFHWHASRAGATPEGEGGAAPGRAR